MSAKTAELSNDLLTAITQEGEKLAAISESDAQTQILKIWTVQN